MPVTEEHTLFVIYNDKDELLANELRKLVETKDDNLETGEIVGTEDGTISIVPLTEKKWLDTKCGVSTSEKVLYIGNLKGTDKLIPIINVKYEKYGIMYGWAGNQAVLTVDSLALIREKNYNNFIEQFKKELETKNNNTKKKFGLSVSAFVGGVGAVLLPIGFPALFLGATVIKNLFNEKEKVREQQYLYGIVQLYHHHLEDFIKA